MFTQCCHFLPAPFRTVALSLRDTRDPNLQTALEPGPQGRLKEVTLLKVKCMYRPFKDIASRYVFQFTMFFQCGSLMSYTGQVRVIGLLIGLIGNEILVPWESDTISRC